MRALATALLGVVAACASDGTDPSIPTAPPTLELTSPARATFANGDTIVVTGTVTGAKGTRLTVDGVEVDVGASGAFSTTVSVAAGIAILETRAFDTAGQEVRDVRAILAGATAPTDGSVGAPIGARAGVAAINSIASALATAAEQIDFTAAAQALNPVYNNTGCLGARIDITSVSVANIDAALAPKTGQLTADVALDNVVVRLHANFKVACVGGSTDITVRSTKARVHGDLGVAVRSGKLDTSLAGVTVALDGFSVDVGGVPSQIENLLKDQARDAAVNALSSAIRDRVPPLADTALAKLVAKPIATSILGRATAFSIEPASVALTPSGLFVAVDTAVTVDGGEGGVYAASPAPIGPSLLNSRGIGLAISDDGANQLFAGLWAAGAFDLALPIEDVGPLAILLDDDARTIEVSLALPPTLSTDAGVQLSVGELTVTTRDAAGAEVQRLALALRTSVSAQPSDGKLALTLGEPEVRAQVLVQSAAVERLLTGEQIEGIVTSVWGLVGTAVSDALGKLPMPSLAGFQLGAPTIEGRDGFVIADLGS